MPKGQYDRTAGKTEKPTELAGMLKAIDAIDRKIARAQVSFAEMLEQRAALRKAIDGELAKRDKQFASIPTPHMGTASAETPADGKWTAQRLRTLMEATGLDAKAIASRCGTDPTIVMSWATGNGPFYPLKNSLAILEELERAA